MRTDVPAARPPVFGEHNNAVPRAAPPEDGGARSSDGLAEAGRPQEAFGGASFDEACGLGACFPGIRNGPKGIVTKSPMR
jgi:hypothetical protein